MRYQYPKVSAQAALIESLLPEFDKVLGDDFNIVPLSELSPIGIDRIIFLQMIQFSAYYVVDAARDEPGFVSIPLYDESNQLLWIYQSLASWLVLGSLVTNTISIFNMNDFKTRLVNWKKNAERGNCVLVSDDELNLFRLKSYEWKVSEATAKKAKGLTWSLSFYQQYMQPQQPRSE